MPQCQECRNEATRVLVDYMHNVIEPKVFLCETHASGSETELCPCCNSYAIETLDEKFNEIEMLPVYPVGALDDEGCCSEHP
ncbi:MULTISPECIES: hypothetical protein [Pantoea]|jgi:hypothetical protein|uniref:hypothetical protein n=1 Tax=Pantoea TaxID=53335 RepID=UPI0011C47A98|nr:MULTISPECIES: hypothetical protein [Pantoea]MBZ6385514.1 hypothetical protein [Pantoea piersonii]MBZ6398942.1 hypothetical protein [Pantoea piersonii]MBZ6407560.1 hypothetical protein [Pantoea piersonii]MBZ6425489.1 hypothetical protein [Pantoea piersonii]NYB00987.1 hypothetical protein [Pantoea piersonii]